MSECLDYVRATLPTSRLECRIDSAFFNETILSVLDGLGVEFSCSVPFERFPKLKKIIEQRQRWHRIDDEWSCFESDWAPDCWDERFRLLVLRLRRPEQLKGPLQLDLFEPRDHIYEYKVIATNKTQTAKAVLLFHNGRGSQEKIFGEAKQNVALDLVPTRRKVGNQLFTLAGMLAHNLARELQMTAAHRQHGTLLKRPSCWDFLSLGTIRQRLLHRAGSLSRPQGELTLTMNANDKVQQELSRFLDVCGVDT